MTEDDLVSDFDKTSAILNRLKAFGINVAIDDFCKGYSSMAYLKWLPASILKVDRSFVQNIPESAADCRVLKAIITLAKLDLDDIVEGVETIDQARLCQQYGADMFRVISYPSLNLLRTLPFLWHNITPSYIDSLIIDLIINRHANQPLNT